MMGEVSELVEVGEAVLVSDETGDLHPALVTAVHGPKCINAVYVTSDRSKTDPYGLQLERLSSLQMKSGDTAFGRWFIRMT